MLRFVALGLVAVLIVPTVQSGTPPTPVSVPNPEAWWKLNEPSGTSAADSTGNGHTGTTTGAVTLGVSAHEGTGYDFPGGTTARVDVPHSTGLESASFTTVAWVRIDVKDDSFPRIVDKESQVGADRHGYYMNYATTAAATGEIDVFQCTFRTVTTLSSTLTDEVMLFGTTKPVVGTFYHVGCSYDGVRARLFVNGVQEDEEMFSDGDFSSGAVFVIGNRNTVIGANRPWNGVIDDVRYYGQALTSEQIMEVYSPGSTANLCITRPPTEMNTILDMLPVFFLAGIFIGILELMVLSANPTPRKSHRAVRRRR